MLFKKIAALPSRRQCVFSGQTVRPRIAEQPQRRGRPKNSSGPKVYELATAAVGGVDLDEAVFFFSLPHLLDRCTLTSNPPHPFRIGVGVGWAQWGQPAGRQRQRQPCMPHWTTCFRHRGEIVKLHPIYINTCKTPKIQAGLNAKVRHQLQRPPMKVNSSSGKNL